MDICNTPDVFIAAAAAVQGPEEGLAVEEKEESLLQHLQLTAIDRVKLQKRILVTQWSVKRKINRQKISIRIRLISYSRM